MNKRINILLVGVAIALQPIVAEIFRTFRLKRIEERISVILGFAGTGKSECLTMIKINLESKQSKMNCLGLWDMQAEINASPDNLLQDIRHKAKNAMGRKVILLDNIHAWMTKQDGNDEGMFFDKWERELIKPLLYEFRDVFIVVTTSRPLFWNDPDVTSNIHLYELKSPTLEKIIEIRRNASLKLKKEYQIALGYLMAASELEREPESGAHNIAKSATNFVKEQVPQNVRNILPDIAIAPLLNIPLLRRLVKNDNKEITHGKAVELLNGLLNSGLLIPLNDISAYRFTDGGIRRLLMREFKNSNPEGFFQKHQQAEEYFQMQSRYAGSLHRSIVGAIYHTAVLAANLGDAQVKCKNWITQNNDNLEGADRRRVLEAWITSDDDPHLKEELMEMLGEDGFKMITKSLEMALG